MCSAQQNPARTVSGVNPETIVLYAARPTPAKTRRAPLSRRVTFWAQDRLLLWLSLDPKEPKKLVYLFIYFFILPFPSLPPCLFTEALLISQRLTRPVRPWSSHEIPVGTQQGSQGGSSSNRSLWVSTCASAWRLTLQWQFRVTVWCVRRHPTCLLNLCYL